MPVGNPFSNPARSNAPGYRPTSRYGGGAGTLFRGPGGGTVAVPQTGALQRTGGFSSQGSEQGMMGGSEAPMGAGFGAGITASKQQAGPSFNPLLNFMDRNRTGIAVGDFRRKLMQQQM